MIEHLGIVESIDNGQTTVSVATGGCRSCHKESECGIGQVAGGRHVTQLTLPAPPGLQVGESVRVRIGEDSLRHSALFGYLLPPVLLLLGAGLGYASYGSDVATAVGALIGFLLALGLARLLPARLPELLTGSAPAAPMTFSPAHDSPAKAAGNAHGQPHNP